MLMQLQNLNRKCMESLTPTTGTLFLAFLPFCKHDKNQLILFKIQLMLQSPHSDYVTRCYFNLCLQQGSRDNRIVRDVLSFLYV